MRTGFYATLACVLAANAYADDFAEVDVEAESMLPEVGDMLYDVADLFMQVSTQEPEPVGTLFSQVNSLVDSFIEN